MIAALRMLVTAAIATATSLAAAPAAAQESLSAARDLYARAAYEDALVLLDRLRVADHPADDARVVEQYRAFCLLALGRNADAQGAIEAVVHAEPLYRPSNADVSPRLLAAFSEVRKRVLPAIVQQRYADAKTAFDRKEWSEAERGFQQVLDVLADSDLRQAASQPPLSDLKMLATGFRDLARTAVAPPPPPPEEPPPPAPSTAPLDPPAPPRAPLEPPAPPPTRIYTLDDSGVVAPVPLRQTLPPFPARSVLMQPSGSLEVVIDERGNVESAVIRSSLNAAYDRQVVAAARAWEYKPATLAGVPVKFRKIVQIIVKR